MPRIPELSVADAAPAVQKMMAAQEAYFGFVLNPTKLMGHCPTIVEGAQSLMEGIEAAGGLEGGLRSLLYSRVASLNGCPF
ncbi:MAG: hypothetical protein HKP27_04430 [Myxococcales bacterium]|nr:hypothetical protein [Myxococcales bacterium]